MITIQCCAGCKWYRDFNGGCCRNIDSDNYADFLEPDHYCEGFEDAKNEET